jgi:pimeloyl-ACP methyl ester carboxylesterase
MYLKVNGTRLFFDIVGSALQPTAQGMIPKPILILLHGGPGVIDHSYFRPLMDPLGEFAQVIYLDLRGQGRSARQSPEYYQVGIMADDVAAFCAELGIEHPVVLGHSFGGCVALSLAVRHPELPGRLILLATSPRENAGWDLDCLERIAGKELREVAARIVADQATEEDGQRFQRELVPFFSYPPKPEVVSLLDRNPFRNEDIGRQMDERFPHTYDVQSQLASIASPTLVLHGRNDWVVPINESEEMAQKIPNAQLHIFEQAGHSVPYDTPEELIEQIRLFLS